MCIYVCVYIYVCMKNSTDSDPISAYLIVYNVLIIICDI